MYEHIFVHRKDQGFRLLAVKCRYTFFQRQAYPIIFLSISLFRQTLSDTLCTADDVLQNSLLKIRNLCEEQCSSLQHEPAKMLFIDDKFGEVTLTLEDFVKESSRQADHVNEQLEALRSTCLLITADACQVSTLRFY